MERRTRRILMVSGTSLGLILHATGCRSLRAPEVPPEPSYYSSGTAAPPPVGFSSEPSSVNPYTGALPGTSPDVGGLGMSPSYSSQPATNGYGNNYGTSAYSPSVTPGGGTTPAVPDPEPLQSLPGIGGPATTPAAGAGDLTLPPS